ncbi:MAG: hypothetical protein IPM26_01795 [Saprospiraceae bacterium]|nr:hypothetical protein [Saprospiraceae bacterium]
MRSIFTKIFTLLVSFSLGSVLVGQNINTLTINSPAGIAGNYEVVRAAFGSTSNNPITANAAFGRDASANPTHGCNALTNSLTGLIGFVDRGSCTFIQKAQRAQAAGAIALVICQNAPDWPFVAEGTDPNITIPVFTISLADCQKIRTDILAGGVNATLRFFFECSNEDPQYGEKVIWGKNPGEGDFTGGFNGWSFDKDNLWEWNGTGQITKQSYSADVNMMSFTRCDGFAEFNSDFLDNGGGGAFGSGPCPSLSPPNGTANVPPCTGELISPNINLTGINVQGIIVEFSQAYRTFRNRYFISASKDGGENWSTPIEINVGRDIYNGRERVALNGFEGASQIRIKFIHFGQYYYWAIDDVVIINDKFPDLKVNDNFYSVSPQLRTPKSQVSEIPLLADIENIGNAGSTRRRPLLSFFR